ncbi:MAG: hypothetical protein EXS31_04760 [Pedosphaera sp.]|nr:hypothetical protein [Pedosphaera sp.]
MKNSKSSWRCLQLPILATLCALTLVQYTRAAAVDNTPPTIPTGLGTTVLNCGEVSLKWTASTDEGGSAVRGYRIFRSGSYVTEVSAAVTSFTDTGLSPTATYSYTVSATDTAGNESLPSIAVPATTTACSDTTPPSVPTDLLATTLDCSSVSLRWNASVDVGGSGIRGYRILRNGVYVTEVDASHTAFLDTGLSPNRACVYRISAKDRSGNESSASQPGEATTLPCNDSAPPSSPTGLLAAALDCNQIILSWNASVDEGGSGIRGYRIARNGVYVTEVPAAATKFIDSGLSATHTYIYSLTAKDRSDNESSGSNTASATTAACDANTAPSIPTNLKATAATCGQINLTWQDSIDIAGVGIRGYKVYRNGVYVTEVSGPAYSDASVSPHRAYEFRVSAVGKSRSESIQSNAASVVSPSCGVLFKGDFNLDRQTDIVLQNTDGSVAFWAMKGTTIAGSAVPYQVPAGWRIVGTGDLDLNDASDVILENTDGSVAFWFMDGVTIKEGVIAFTLPSGNHIVATGDFDSDGQVDLIVQDSSGTVSFWFMKGAAVDRKETGYALPAGWRVAGTGRFDIDGDTDIVLQKDDGTVAFWFLKGTTLLNGITPYSLPVGWKIVATGNFNSDNDTDIVLQHTDGSVAFWLLNGTTIVEGLVPYTVPAGWEIVGPR